MHPTLVRHAFGNVIRRFVQFVLCLLAASCGAALDPDLPPDEPIHSIGAEGPVEATASWRVQGGKLFVRLVLQPLGSDSTEVTWGHCALRSRAYADSAHTELNWTDERVPVEGVTFNCLDMMLMHDATRSDPAVIEDIVDGSSLVRGLPRRGAYVELWIKLNNELVGLPAEYVPSTK